MALKQISEQDCWFVIGAHQAGATERQCSELSGLSKTVTHNIISNFKKLGSPHASKLSVNALLNNSAATNKNNNNKRKNSDSNEKPMLRKRGRPRKPAEAPFFTQFIVRDTLIKARTVNSTNNNTTDQQQKTTRNLYSSSPQIYPLDRLDTPPNDDPQQPQHKAQKRRESYLVQLDELPLTPRSITLAMDELSSDEEGATNTMMEEEKKEEGEEEWSFQDDENLLMHVLNLPMNNLKWKKLETQFGDRHMAKMCFERWDFIKKQLIKDIKIVVKEEEADKNSDSVLQHNF